MSWLRSHFPWLFGPDTPHRLYLLYYPRTFAVNEKIYADFTPPTHPDTTPTVEVHYALDGGADQVVSTFTDSPDNAGMKRAEIDVADGSKGVAWLVFANRLKSKVTTAQPFDVTALYPDPDAPAPLVITFGGEVVPAAPEAPAGPPA